MEDNLKERWKAVCLELKNTGYTKVHVAKQVGISKTAIYCYSTVWRGRAKFPQYATLKNTEKLEKFFGIKHQEDEAA